MELILNTFGTSLNRDNEGFVITHKDGRQRIPVDGIKSIQISKGAQITSDAVILAVEHEIEVLFMDKSGMPIGRIWSPKYGSISTIRKGQLNFTFSKEALVWIKEVIRKKIENQQALLLMMQSDDAEICLQREKAIGRLEDYRAKIASVEGEIVSDVASQLRGWEGISSKIYFEALNWFIPEGYRFESRSQHPAMDVVNAFLNYGYGILYGKIEGALIKAGIDPYVGVLHRDDYNRPVLVYDVIELYRVWVDYVVYSLAAQQVVTDEFYSVRDDGSYWLEGLGRRILIQSLNDYLEEVIQVKGVSRSRLTQIQLYAQDLAQQFKRFE
ncbi:CRISPR-associated endonuclease Cas1 [Bacteroides graminisolvens]|jgi:CRISPR-associated protein Cas1|uniref:CRISPR-associated endonuclease Cas1 n=1 Tax=Bacteroides graminisolvens TaxID=477666 RepID=UPI001B3D969E|nr:CRISPR-associated endonuclease Cas1 [Bacteroides graminisolvens]MBP7473199.1 CRISPR-associated endonuclease Cas1 [Prevotella sp.]